MPSSDWLRVNGETIYGTRHASRDCQWSDGKRPGQQYGEYRIPYNLMEQMGQIPKEGKAVKQAFFTKKPNALYAITRVWPGQTPCRYAYTFEITGAMLLPEQEK